jgi:hypothetical protein
MCDRTLCPMKLAIRSYCNEGHDILSAKGMKRAQLEGPVSGVRQVKIDKSKMSAEVKPIKNFIKTFTPLAGQSLQYKRPKKCLILLFRYKYYS